MKNIFKIFSLGLLFFPNSSNSAFEWTQPKACSLSPISTNYFINNQISIDSLKGKFLVGRKAVFSVRENGRLIVQSEQNFSAHSETSNSPTIKCAGSSQSKLNFSILAPTVLDWRMAADSRPVIWQFNTLQNDTGYLASNFVSRVLSSELTPELLFEELKGKVSIYKVSSDQFAIEIKEKELSTEKSITMLYDVAN